MQKVDKKETVKQQWRTKNNSYDDGTKKLPKIEKSIQNKPSAVGYQYLGDAIQDSEDPRHRVCFNT